MGCFIRVLITYSPLSQFVKMCAASLQKNEEDMSNVWLGMISK